MKIEIKQLIYFATGGLVIMLLAALPARVLAQKNTYSLNSKLEALAKPRSTPEWIDFREGTSINPYTLFTDLKDAFDLSKDDEMRVYKTQSDKLGFKHYRYQQFYKNVPVVYGEFLVHQQGDGFVSSANGRLIRGLRLPNTPSVSESQALSAGMHFMNAKKYLWQNSDLEKELKRQEKNEAATYYPKGELVYAPGNFNATFLAEDYRLAWHFKIYTDDPSVIAKSVYIDAFTGRVIHSMDIAMNCSGATGTSAFNGTVSFSTESSGGSFRSHNDCQSTDIYVYNCNGGGASNTFYTDADNTWTLASQQSAVQCQWGARQTYNYYLGEHSRTSWDNAAGDMIAYNNANAGQNNACWGCTGNSTIFYAGNTSAATDDWNTDDIVGHEFTHGVTQASSNLAYQDESGALNESFSDIFGEMVESWSEGTCDYLVGADRGAIRSFITPNTYSNPDTYKGTYWYTGTADHGGVHTNSGVQNHWFYLLSEGGSGTNDFGTSYNVTGITRFKARDITYRALDNYITSSSQYIDARAATLHAAYDLYGQCSQEIIAVGDAWHAVGVESQSAQFTKNACGTYSNGEFVQSISQLTAANGCTTTVNSATNIVYFTARDRVILYPGFRAVSGSRFVAYLEPCSSTMWKSSGDDDVIKSDAEKGITSPVVYEKELHAELPPMDQSIAIAPNPFTSAFSLAINSKQDVKAQVFIYNSLGIKVKEKSGINLSKGSNNLSFDCSGFAKGVYMVEIFMGNEKVVKKVIKM